MVTLTVTTNVPQPIEEASQSYNNEQRPASIPKDHHQSIDDLSSSSKHVVFNDDENNDDENLSASNSDEQPMWLQVPSKHYANKMVRASRIGSNGGDNRLWAIPYRFGKRAAMPYRFGKRAAAMHFRLGKKSASL